VLHRLYRSSSAAIPSNGKTSSPPTGQTVPPNRSAGGIVENALDQVESQEEFPQFRGDIAVKGTAAEPKGGRDG
jgi:hypothetical protein